MTVDVPAGTGDGMPTVFEIIYDAIDKVKYLKCRPSELRRKRQDASTNAKVKDF